ncbi:hypothetical protein MMC11_008007 [Xylographa trunciseda]|nr:hypothetical protein [Xylographa trunciseda]
MLFLKPQLLSNLRNIEIEDVLSKERLWCLEEVLDKLFAVPALNSIVLGINVFEESFGQILRLCSRTFNALFARYYGTIWLEPPYGSQDAYATWKEERDRVSAAFRMEVNRRRSPSLEEWYQFSRYGTASKFSIRIDEFPKVLIVNFLKRDSYQRQTDIKNNCGDTSGQHVQQY